MRRVREWCGQCDRYYWLAAFSRVAWCATGHVPGNRCRDLATHDYVYIDDVVDAFVRAGCAPVETIGTYNIGSGRHTTLTEVHALMSAVLDGTSQPSFAMDLSVESHAVALQAKKAKDELG